ncbi:hypothetical protein [Mesorhizobium sp. M0047]
MAENLSRDDELRGTRKVLKWGVVIATVLFIVLLAIFVLGPRV